MHDDLTCKRRLPMSSSLFTRGTTRDLFHSQNSTYVRTHLQSSLVFADKVVMVIGNTYSLQSDPHLIHILIRLLRPQSSAWTSRHVLFVLVKRCFSTILTKQILGRWPMGHTAYGPTCRACFHQLRSTSASCSAKPPDLLQRLGHHPEQRSQARTGQLTDSASATSTAPSTPHASSSSLCSSQIAFVLVSSSIVPRCYLLPQRCVRAFQHLPCFAQPCCCFSPW